MPTEDTFLKLNNGVTNAVQQSRKILTYLSKENSSPGGKYSLSILMLEDDIIVPYLQATFKICIYDLCLAYVSSCIC